MNMCKCRLFLNIFGFAFDFYGKSKTTVCTAQLKTGRLCTVGKHNYSTISIISSFLPQRAQLSTVLLNGTYTVFCLKFVPVTNKADKLFTCHYNNQSYKKYRLPLIVGAWCKIHSQ